MTQHILMIVPSTEDEKPRLVGPFLTESTATAWADREQVPEDRRLIRLLESPTSLYGYGRHALIPSPTPRRVVAEAVKDWEAKKADLATGGRPITNWVEAHADQLQRFAPLELPERKADE